MAEHGFGYLLMHSGTSPILIEHVAIRFIFPEHLDFDILARSSGSESGFLLFPNTFLTRSCEEWFEGDRQAAHAMLVLLRT
jgi:hypothetical protein